jgi:predicted metal-binding membrane protein
VVVAWLTMIVAMMTPTVWPWVSAFHRFLAHAAGGTSPLAGTLEFIAGYTVMWLAFSTGAAVLQLAFAAASPAHADRVTPLVGAAILMAAGLFQFLPIKRACLRHCRNPLSYFLARWRNGPSRPFRLGLAHGGYCLGCCWLVMGTAFAMGVMNLGWMILLTVIVCAEQLAPTAWQVDRAAGAGFIAWGLWVIVR